MVDINQRSFLKMRSENPLPGLLLSVEQRDALLELEPPDIGQHRPLRALRLKTRMPLGFV
jgi:hypothetical protein